MTNSIPLHVPTSLASVTAMALINSARALNTQAINLADVDEEQARDSAMAARRLVIMAVDLYRAIGDYDVANQYAAVAQKLRRDWQ
jgi:hypothetical protein